ncbi:cytochrome c oxidase subunit 4 [Galactobacter valiniphilus]|uniref:cytochrome c oxidase subunit 4 n=1 Tax=Galactobacter valiniphilus TaxID=2676122 RepID=UPI0037358D02
MRPEANIFLGGIIFIPLGITYGFLTQFKEWVGFPAFLLLGAMSLMVGIFLRKTGKSMGPRPEDRSGGEIAERSGVYGTFAPASWWPLVLGIGTAVAFLGLAVGLWVLFIGAGIAIVGVLGWVFEFSAGDWAH